LTVRDARPDEWETVGRLTLNAYETAEILGADPAYRAQLLDAAARAEPPGAVFVAVAGGHEGDGADDIVGAVAYCPYGSNLAEISRPGEAEFRMLAVAPHAQGKGVGRALVATCIERTRAEDLDTLVLSVIDHNQAAATMYARLGFTRRPERDWRPGSEILLRVWVKDVR
jgi:ribosomal protein S18 acetylase RimI-like enzyme